MIRSFHCKGIERLFSGICPRQFRQIRTQAERKLIMLHSAESIEFLNSPPGNQLEKLSGDRRTQWSIRINRQWRLCFRYENGDAFDVEIADYH